MRWKLRSAPERSTFTAMPGYLASNALPTFSASARSTELYQVTLPSFFAASISCGVMLSAAGADWAERTKPLAIRAVVEPASTRRRVSLRVIGLSSCQSPASFGRQAQPHVLPRCNFLGGRRRRPERRLVVAHDGIVARGPEEDLAADCTVEHVGLGRCGARHHNF